MDLATLARQVPAGCGPIGLLSSDEFTPAARDFDRALLGAARGARIAVVLCADHRNAILNARNARDYFAGLGAVAEPLDIAHDPDATLPRAIDADIIYIAGGGPDELLRCLHAPLGGALLDAWRDGVALAGSSAGAMALCEHCLIPTQGAPRPTQWARGLGPLCDIGLAVHASERSRDWLAQIASSAPAALLALDNAAGIILRANDEPITSGAVRFEPV